MLRNYIKIAWRNMGRHKVFTFINVVGLALGLCACMVIFLVSRYELSFDNFHPDKERIYRIGSKMKVSSMNDGDVPPPVVAALRKELTGIESVAGYFPWYSPAVKIPAAGSTRKFESKPDEVIIADSGYFSIFKYEWLAGNPTAALNDAFKVVLTEDKARQYFGSIAPAAMIGKDIIYEDSLQVTVSGIVKNWTANSDFAKTDFISFATIQSSFLKNTRHLENWQMIKGMGQYFWPVAFVKLAKGATIDRVNAQLNSLVKEKMGQETAKGFVMQLQPLSDIHFNSSYSDESIRKANLPTLYALMAIAAFILIIAAINFINLATAQSLQRAKEIAVRKVLGSSRKSLVFQFLAETFLLCLVAITLAALFVKPVLALFNDFIPKGVQFDITNPATLLFLAAVTVVTSLLAGFYPARIASRYLPVTTLKGASIQKGSESWWLRKALIIFQFSISLGFVIGVLVIGKQIRYMLRSDFGFKTDEIVTLDNWSWQDDINKTKFVSEKIKQIPGVDKVILEFGPPMGWGVNMSGVTYKGKVENKLDVQFDSGDENFISFYQMKIVAGRNITHSDSLTEFVINETCSKALGFSTPQDAIGKFLFWNQRTIPIAGVVADFHQGSFRDAIRPLVIGHQPFMERSIAIKLASAGKDAGVVREVLAKVEKIWKQNLPEKTFLYSFIDDTAASFYESERKTSKLMQSAMAITIFISCIGLFGLVMFTAEKRRREIGIRKVLGASVANITVLLTREFETLVVLSLFIASPLAWIFMNKWLQGFAYRIPVNGWIFILAGLAGIFITLVTVSFHAIKSAIANPVKSLRTE